jgi:Leucine-rich repeat (LRR) protein
MAVIWMFLSLITFCSKDKEEESIPVPTNLKIEGSPVSVEAAASTASFTVLSNKDWTAEAEVAWLTFTPSSGKASSNLSVEVTVSANTETTSRSTVITVKAGDKTAEVEVEQKGKVIIPGIEIADPAFKRYLLENFDADEDGEISTGEAETVSKIDCSGKEIESLSGIEYFVDLDTLICHSNALTKIDLNKNPLLSLLNCSNNQIDSLGISENTQLRSLDCSSNKLAEVDLIKNVNLIHLDCSSNRFAGIDISRNVSLATLNCSSNELTALDVSKNMELTTLICSGNQLAALDVSKNTALETLDCTENETLGKIILAKDQTIPNLFYDEETTVIEYPVPEKKIVHIPDEKFKAYMVAGFDTDKDREISEEEALAIKEIRCNPEGIASLEGIASCVNLEILVCNKNKLSSVDISKNVQLKDFNCSENELERLDVSENIALTKLYCYSCNLSQLDVKSNTALIEMNCHDNNLEILDVSANVSLQKLYCQKNELTALDLRKNLAINTLNVRNNSTLKSIYLEENQVIPNLYMDTPPTSLVYPHYISGIRDKVFMEYLIRTFDSDGDGKISEMESEEIEAIDCSRLNVSSLEGIALFTNLTSLICSGNNLTSIDISANPSLITFVCDSNNLEELNVSANRALVALSCSGNRLTSLNVASNKDLKTLICNDNKLLSLTVTKNTKLETLLCQDNDIIRMMDLSNNLSLKMMNCKNNRQLARLYLKAGQKIETLLKDDDVTNIKYFGEEGLSIDIPDENFRNYLVENFDKNEDSEISKEEALLIKTINCSNKDINSLSGMEYLVNLQDLNCSGNNLTSLSLSANTALRTLDCSDNQLSTMDIIGCTELRQLYCENNNLTSLNVMRNTKLTDVDCQNNRLSSLNIRRNPDMKTLMCVNNNSGFIVYMASSQTSVNVSAGAIKDYTNVAGVTIEDAPFEDYLISNFDKNGDGSIDNTERDAVTNITCRDLNISSLEGINAFTNLLTLDCSGNNLTSLELSGTKLMIVYCNDNKLKTINVSGCTALEWLYCPGNELRELDLSNNLSLTVLDCMENGYLQKVYLKDGVHNIGMIRKDTHTVVEFK